MSELLESFAMGTAHKTKDPKCPFCPKETNQEHYTTYPGVKNDPGKLGDVVDAPSKFGTSIESDARPKDGAAGKDDLQNQDLEDTETKAEVQKEDDDWTFQCHHAISGNQCLKNDPVEKFIVAGDKLKYDTGYSINNPQNGVWLPSRPKNAAWPSDPAKKYELAKAAMKTFKRQFHLGHHNIPTDVDGIDEDTDENYVDYIKGQLEDINTILTKWEVCPEKDEEKKHRGNPRIHMMFDVVSGHIIEKLKGAPRKWDIWVSRHARDYTIKTRTPKVKLDFE
jgi:hypothetical protein